MNIIGCVPRFIKAHAGWILTGLSILGLTGTAVLVAKETPEVVDIMKEADYDKWKEWDYDICQQVKAICPANNHEKWVKEYERLILQAPYPGLTFAEKFEIAAPRYLPAFPIHSPKFFSNSLQNLPVVSQKSRVASVSACISFSSKTRDA